MKNKPEEKTDKTKDKSKLRRHEKILIGIGIFTMIAYIFFSSGIILKEMQNALSNSVFAVLNLLAAFFIAYKISYFSAFQQHLSHQKSLAKTSVRHLRNHLTSLYNLQVIIDKKAKNNDDKLVGQYFDEFKNHVINIMNGISASEYDFKDIVGEEFKEESILVGQIFSDMAEAKEKNREINEMRKKEAKSNEEEIENLKEEIKNLSKKIDDNVSELPFGGSLESLPVSASSLATISGEIPISVFKPMGKGYLWGESKGHLVGRSDSDGLDIGEEASMETLIPHNSVGHDPLDSDDGEKM
ncbi:MAG: hypothetical protein JRL30_09690 [Deltaproteobacteria bacterium]|nr:hypothetical protein [Deltaproteobacteria bacterium]